MLFTGCTEFSPACSGAENDYINFSTWYVTSRESTVGKMAGFSTCMSIIKLLVV